MRIAHCPSCGARFDVSRHEPGKKVRCGRCKSIFIVPFDDATGTPAPTAVPGRTTTSAPPTSRPVQALATRQEQWDEKKETEESGDGGTVETTAVAARSTAEGRSRAVSSAARVRGREPQAKRPFPAGIIAAAAFAGVAALGGLVWYLTTRAEQRAATQELPWITAKKQEFKQRYEALDRTNPDQLFELHKWCAQWPDALGKEAKDLLDRLIELKPDHPGALGRIRAIYEEKAAAARAANTEEAWLAVAEFCDQYKLTEERDAAAHLVLKINKSNERANRMLGRVPLKNEKGEIVWEDAEMVAASDAIERGKAAESEFLAQLDERGKRVYKLANERLRKATKSSEVWEWKGHSPLTAESPSWVLADSRPYVLIIEKSDKYSETARLDEIGTVLRELYQMFYDTYAVKFNLTAMDNEVIMVFIFKDTESYREKTAVSQFAAAHYDPTKESLMLPNDLHDMYGVVFHEGTHQLVDFAAKLRGKIGGRPFWFEEGIATNFEAFTRDKTTGKFIIGALAGLPKDNYLNTIKTMIKQKTYTPFKQMISLTYTEGARDPNPQQVAMNYAQSWSMVYFLYTYDNGKYRSKWEEYFVAEISGEGGKHAFERIIGNPDDIEKEWLAYIPTVFSE